VVRLLVTIFVCLYAASIVTSVVHQIGAGKAHAGFLALAGSGVAALAASFFLIRKPLSSSRPARQLAAAMACFYAGMMLGFWIQKMAGPTPHSVLQMVISAIGFQGSVILLMILFTREHGVEFPEAFGLRVFPGRAVAYGIIMAGLFLPVARLLQQGSGDLMRLIPGLYPEEQQAVQTLRMAGTFGERLALGIITIGLAPVAEELLFRGVLYPWIRQFGFPRLAIWITSLLFAAVHFNLATFVPLAAFSFGLTWLYRWQGNLLSPITAHATFNAMNFSILYIMERMEQANPLK